MDGQTQVQGFTGEDVLLSCTYTSVQQLKNDTSVYWMDKDDNILLKMTKNGADYSKQNGKYVGRVDAFPELLKAGNFSVLLKNCQPSDSGQYECSILTDIFSQRLNLNISGLHDSENRFLNVAARKGRFRRIDRFRRGLRWSPWRRLGPCSHCTAL